MPRRSFSEGGFDIARRGMSLRLRFAFAFCLVSSFLLPPSSFLSAATPEDVRLNSATHKPINPAIDLSTTTVTFATDQIPQAKVTGLPAALAGKVNNTGDETIAGIKTFSSKPVVPANAFPESATLNLVSDLAGKVNNTGDETIAGIKTFSSAPVVPAAAFPESAIASLIPDLAGKVNNTGNETIGGIKTFSSSPVVPAAAFHESATLNLTSDLAAKALDSAVVHNTGAEAIAGVKTFSSAPVVPAAAFPESATLNLTSDLAAKALDSAVVHNTGNETINGNKTFSGASTFNATAAITYTDSSASTAITALSSTPTVTGAAAALVKGIASAPVSTANITGGDGRQTFGIWSRPETTANVSGAAPHTVSGLFTQPQMTVTSSDNSGNTFLMYQIFTDGEINGLSNVGSNDYVEQYGAKMRSADSLGTSSGNRRKKFGIYLDTPGSADLSYGAYIDLYNGVGGGATTAYGVYSLSRGTGATNYAGYFSASGATTNYGLYSAAGLNHFAGNADFGADLAVRGNLAVTGTTSASSTGTGSITVNSLGTPGTPTVTPQGLSGATTWSYRIVAKLADGTGTAGSFPGSTTSGEDTLDTNNYNNLAWLVVPGAVSYDVYRIVAGFSPNTLGKIANVASASYSDKGAAGDGATVPNQNTTGNIQWLADNISDIGAASSGRPRDLNVARNVNIGGTGTVGGTLSSAAQISNLNFIDVSRIPYSADMTGTVDGTAAFNAAISDAATGNKTVFIPGILKITSTISINSETVLLGVPYKSKILWGGGGGGTMMRITGAQRGGIRDLVLDCNKLAATGLIISGSSFGDYTDLSITDFTTGAGLQLTGVAATCSWNTFTRLVLYSATNGNSCLWLGDSTSNAGNACHNVFINLYLQHQGTRPGIRLGYCDNNAFYQTFIFRASGTNAGVLVDPTDPGGLPSENMFSLLEAGTGGWVQPGTTTACPATIYGYATGNGQPAPVTNGTPLIVYFSDARGPTWIAPTLVNGWVNFGAPQQLAGYTKDQNNRIWLRGLIKSGTFSDTTTLFTLPAGYTPSGHESFAVNSSGAFGLIIILTTGEVKISGATANSALSLAGISFSGN